MEWLLEESSEALEPRRVSAIAWIGEDLRAIEVKS